MFERSTHTLHCCRNGSDYVRSSFRDKLPDDSTLPPSYVHSILRRILQLYPYKLQLCHELCQQIPHRGKHLRSGPSLKWKGSHLGF
ncbi:hypothetical protein TNCV_5005761 [Trichonephila clavipes]|nr:hypothetical protein TNCV_5005761 [Trichonephila clavipes]